MKPKRAVHLAGDHRWLSRLGGAMHQSSPKRNHQKGAIAWGETKSVDRLQQKKA